jgi:two-component sensor histidine kinase
MERYTRLGRVLTHLNRTYYAGIRSVLTRMAIAIVALHIIDMVESYLYDYTASLIWESIRIGAIVLVMFPLRWLGLEERPLHHVMLALPMIFFYGTLWLPDENAALTLAWLVFLAVLPFWLFSRRVALRWAYVQLGILGGIVLLSGAGVIHTLYNTSMLFQLWGVIAVTSYIAYRIEVKRQLYRDKLEGLAIENRLLYDEVTHRTKNNLQFVISLIEQEGRYEGESARAALQRVGHHVRALDAVLTSRVVSDEERIDFLRTAQRIVEPFRHEHRCRIVLAIEPIRLKQAEGNYLGLILNAAIRNIHTLLCNASAEGEITVTLRRSDRQIVLEIVGVHATNDKHTVFQATDEGRTHLIRRLAEALPQGRYIRLDDTGLRLRIAFASSTDPGERNAQESTE